ncbi:MAG: prepilin-type N-terminal cleavage/methylation domain-containing protein [Defluviitaleaceae bacterium]|nr:prepilin-type N-terminal cleavage/methylation domain-containing protein [Defluviitaleaceae bacterium]MCL2262149.1 prepilin-type N-terminal cleavage/methylation domain-containing protein [Defluviitaleaceae bacterium]
MNKNLINSKNRKGFTLVELIVVVAVLALLAVGAVIAIAGIQRNARIASNRTAALQLADTFNNYLAAGGDETTVDGAGGSSYWEGIVDIGIGDPLEFRIAFSSAARFDQVLDWIDGDGNVWVLVADDDDLDEVAA